MSEKHPDTKVDLFAEKQMAPLRTAAFSGLLWMQRNVDYETFLGHTPSLDAWQRGSFRKNTYSVWGPVQQVWVDPDRTIRLASAHFTASFDPLKKTFSQIQPHPPHTQECILSSKGTIFLHNTGDDLYVDLPHETQLRLPPSTFWKRPIRIGGILALSTDGVLRLGNRVSFSTGSTALCADVLDQDNDNFIYGGIDGTIHITDWFVTKPLTPPTGSPVTCLYTAYSRGPCVYFVSGHFDGSVRIWRVRNGRECVCIAEDKARHNSPVRHIYADTSRLLTAGHDDGIVASDLWDVRRQWFQIDNLKVVSLSCDPSLRFLAVTSGTADITVFDFGGLKRSV